jgi:hypothetical protein
MLLVMNAHSEVVAPHCRNVPMGEGGICWSYQITDEDGGSFSIGDQYGVTARSIRQLSRGFGVWTVTNSGASAPRLGLRYLFAARTTARRKRLEETIHGSRNSALAARRTDSDHPSRADLALIHGHDSGGVRPANDGCR